MNICERLLLYTYESVSYAAKPKSGDGPHYINAMWLLIRDITMLGILQKGREGVLSELSDIKDRNKFSATIHFEKDKKDICLTSRTVKTKSKSKKNDAFLSIFLPLHWKTIDSGKERPQIIKLYDFT